MWGACMRKVGLRSRIGWLTWSLTVVTASMMIALCLAGTAQARPFQDVGSSAIGPAVSVGAQRTTASSSEQCFYSFPNCSSSDPSVKYSNHSDGDTSACTFQETVDWGDKSSTTMTFPGGPDGSTLVTYNHTYTDRPHLYTLTVTATTISGDCGNFSSATLYFTLTAAGVQSGCVGYQQPTDWNTERVDTLTPGVEPLNVIISACSSVPMSSIYQAMSSDWKAGCSGVFKISNERADVAGTGFVNMAQAWRQGGCATGDHLSLFGLEDHVRMWNQPVPGSTSGSAEFFTASFETLCVELHGKLKPFRKQDGTYRTGKPWHCIDGGPGSYFTDGYNDGAKTFARAIVSFAQAQGWWTRLQIETRPANPSSIDENGVAAAGQVYVVTVDYHAPQN
jgi:hypothetical protein